MTARHRCPTCGFQDMHLLRQEPRGKSIYECSKCKGEFPFQWPGH